MKIPAIMFPLTAVAFLLCSSCADLAFSTQSRGLVFGNATISKLATQNPARGPLGRACAHSILGLFTWGDASSIKAARTANIERIATVDEEHFSVLGIFSQVCSIVSGEGQVIQVPAIIKPAG